MMTRAGLVQSVHAFAESSIGRYFAVFLAIGIAATVALILRRLDYLKSDTPLENVVSRESSFLLNNLLFACACVAILIGTLFPVITEWINGQKIALDKPWFNRILMPWGLALLLLMGVAPLLPWRRASTQSLWRNFRNPALTAGIVAAASIAFGVRDIYPLLSLSLCAFVAVSIAIEFFRGARVIAAKSATGLLPAVVTLTLRNTRRYGGYIVHLGIVLIFVGLTGAAFNRATKADVRIGDRLRLGTYALAVRDVTMGEDDNMLWQRASIDVFHGDDLAGGLTPQREVYKSSRQSVGRVDIRHDWNEDLYVNFAGVPSEGSAEIEVYLFPLVSWVWIGALVLAAGTLIALVPSRGESD
jgi:cytochrome c-type biogenesis protein CcmF